MSGQIIMQSMLAVHFRSFWKDYSSKMLQIFGSVGSDEKLMIKKVIKTKAGRLGTHGELICAQKLTNTTWKVDGATPMYWLIMAPY